MQASQSASPISLVSMNDCMHLQTSKAATNKSKIIVAVSRTSMAFFKNTSGCSIETGSVMLKTVKSAKGITSNGSLSDITMALNSGSAILEEDVSTGHCPGVHAGTGSMRHKENINIHVRNLQNKVKIS